MKPLLLLAVAVPLSLHACVRGKVQEKKKPYHILSGEHYHSPLHATGSGVQVVSGFPVLEAKEKHTVVRGKVSIEDPLAVLPSDLQVQLWRDGKLVSYTRAARTGEFELVGNFADGVYQVKLDSKRYKGEGELKISGFRVEDVQLTAEWKGN